MLAEVILLAFTVFFICGGTMLLYQGFLSIEEKRTEESAERTPRATLDVNAVAEMPRFFAKLDQEQAPPVRTEIDDAVLTRLEGYLLSEQLLAAKFVDDPTVENLHRQQTLSA